MGKKTGRRTVKETQNVTAKKYRQEPVCSGNRVLLMSVSALLLFMFVLWLVPEAKQEIPQEFRKPTPKRPERPPKKPKFIHTEEVEAQQLGEETDAVTQAKEGAPEMVVAVLDYGAEGKEAGKTWTRWERIAKNLRTKPRFARYEEDELPVIRRFDCRKPLQLCQALSGAAGKPVMFKTGRQGKLFSNEIRTDKQFLDYMYDELQPALNYIEERTDIVDFIEDNDVVFFLFGEDKAGALEETADGLRDFGKWARNRRSDVAEFFDIESPPQLVQFRDFEPSPIAFQGDLANKEEVGQWVANTNLPVFGEYTDKRSRRYSNFLSQQVSMFFIYIDALDDTFKEVENAVKTELLPFAVENEARVMFSYIDAMTGENIARNMGINEYPTIFGSLNSPDGPKRLNEALDPEEMGKSLVEKFKSFFNDDEDPADDEGYYYEEYDEDMDDAEGGGGGGGPDGAGETQQDGEADGDDYQYEDYDDGAEEGEKDKQDLRRRLLGES